MPEEPKSRLDTILPMDEAVSEQEIDHILDSSNHIGRVGRLALGGAALVLSAAAIEVFRRYRFSPGLPEDD